MFGGEEIGSIEQSHNRTIQQWEILQRLLPLEQVYATKAAIHGDEDVRPFVQSKDRYIFNSEEKPTTSKQ